ncbi:pyruvate kinase [Mycobacterium sp. ITM-2016-00316]|uniref:pyruvate kinase n=1 Tax=Mycobacterium sp. ITM-2016-00316 TaxID=2099695 RepID=UPI000CFA0CA7|nr:pyruvate kinase [Mycobacterium sp. ITM-2016-00316]WNG79851.1 pyruvate kinase [Mycobacterium sp. ITM-2016-00316]
MTTTQIDVDATVLQLNRLRDDVDELLDKSSAVESTWSGWLDAVTAPHRSSARNMLHYIAIRQCDLRGLQTRLSAFGLSSLGRSEANVEATLLLVRSAISAMLGEVWQQPTFPGVRMDQGPELLQHRTQELLGPEPTDRATRIMVTLPSSAATDPTVVHDLVARGMNIARINCAHDDAEAWRSMARSVRQAAAATGRSCLIAMDLAGPKLRTGPLEPGPRILKLQPRKNTLGQVITPASAWLTAAEDPTDPPEAGMMSLPVPGKWLRRRRNGEVLQLHDTRGSKRRLTLSATEDASGGLVATADRTTYLATGTVLHVHGMDDSTHLGELPQTEQSLLLHRGDILELTRDCSPAPVAIDIAPRMGCTLPEIFDCAQVGQKVHLDDGLINGEVIGVAADALSLRIDHAADAGSRLRAGKGVNVPGAQLPISALTDKDIVDLETVVEIADIVDMSFVRDPSDVTQLFDELERLGDDALGIVLKIETRQAFEYLPQLLLTVMQRPRAGVMIARGDLAVECGYERLAELQEEILWLCEAAHLPVIWATQVLDQLAKTGNPSRAEISDAAMSERAECVMLNKGRYINEAVVVLDNILRRMVDHHYKKKALMPSLHSWHPDMRRDETTTKSP